ncbi:hypothetical protein ACWDRB_41665 [Nonomuraea sp. NPDC003707]
MENPAEPISSAYIQVIDSLRIRDRIWDGTQRSRLSPGSVLVVEVFVLAQGVPQVAFVPDQAAGGHYVPAPPSSAERDRQGFEVVYADEREGQVHIPLAEAGAVPFERPPSVRIRSTEQADQCHWKLMAIRFMPP